MGYGAQANNIVKANRALLKKKRTFREIKNSYLGYLEDSQLQFKEVSPFEQQKIRDKIIAQAKRDKAHNIKMGFISFLILSLIVFGIYKLLSA